MIVAKFIGKEDIYGFETNKIYNLYEPDCSKIDWKIMIKNIEGAQWKSYKNIESFLREWEIIKRI